MVGVAINKHNLTIIIKVVFKSRNRQSSYMLVQWIPCGNCVWYKGVEVSICASIRLINNKVSSYEDKEHLRGSNIPWTILYSKANLSWSLWSARDGNVKEFLISRVPLFGGRPKCKFLDILLEDFIFHCVRVPYWACILQMRSYQWQIKLLECGTFCVIVESPVQQP